MNNFPKDIWANKGKKQFLLLQNNTFYILYKFKGKYTLAVSSSHINIEYYFILGFKKLSNEKDLDIFKKAIIDAAR